MIKMDLIDKKIFCELEMNCRTPVSRIAKKLRIGRNVAAYRINRLEKDKIIRKYICSLDLGMLGFKTYKIYFKTKSHKETEEEFVKKILPNKRVVHFLQIEGSYDFAVTIAVKNIVELDNFITDIKSAFKEFIRDYTVNAIVYSKIFKIDKFLLGTEHASIKFENYSGEDRQMELEEKDKRILKALSQQGNLPIVELAKKTKLSVDIIKYRLKKLSKLINSFRIIFDLSKLGLYHYVVLLRMRQNTKKEEEKLISWCFYKQDVFYITKRMGFYDFEINVVIKDINQLNKFLKELKEEFHDCIDSRATIITSKMLKLNYVPF